MTFPELGIRPELVTALAKQGITVPTPIQAAGIPVLLEGKDAYLHAETGTGKTLAYLLPLFCRLDLAEAAPQLVVIAPTHELAIQIQRQCADLAQHSGWAARVLLLIGSTPRDRQLDKLKKKPHIVVGSPGRVLELIRMGRLKTHKLKALVVDEADRLLEEESLPDLLGILKAAPRQRQLVFASATEGTESAGTLAGIAPGLETVRAAAATVNVNIEHLFLVCEERDKPDALRGLLHALRPPRAMVFVHRNETAERVSAKLAHHGIPAADLHGAYDKRDRKRAMDEFRAGTVRVMIASDVAARGLDIRDVTHIFNLDVPTQGKAYLHRVGRTARAGASGVALSLMTEEETRLVRRHEKELNIRFTEVYLREGKVRPVENRR